jgi:hypothetical protein
MAKNRYGLTPATRGGTFGGDLFPIARYAAREGTPPSFTATPIFSGIYARFEIQLGFQRPLQFQIVYVSLLSQESPLG